MTEKICPLSIQGNTSGKVTYCLGKDCMYWTNRFDPPGCSMAIQFLLNSTLLFHNCKANEDIMEQMRLKESANESKEVA